MLLILLIYMSSDLPYFWLNTTLSSYSCHLQAPVFPLLILSHGRKYVSEVQIEIQ